MKDRVRVLYVNGNDMKRGGIEAFMMNYYHYIDKNKVQIDFIVHGNKKGVYDDEIIASGSKIYHVPIKSKHPLRYSAELKKVLKNEKYHIIHSHVDAMSGWVLKIAKECNIPVRIAHSHNTAHLTTNPIKVLINDYAKSQISCYATNRFACSRAAGEWLFGKKTSFEVINNAIDVEKFSFSEITRERIRKEFGFDCRYVIGHVGRFDYQKNQEFLIAVMKEVIITRPDALLVFIGEGATMPRIHDMVDENGLKDNVLFLGSRANINDFYNAFDAFVLPSRFEGLSFVAIEAQANGLPCLLSSQVTAEIAICQNVQFLNITEPFAWAEAICKCDIIRNSNAINNIKSAGYSIQVEAAKLQQFYIERGRMKC